MKTEWGLCECCGGAEGKCVGGGAEGVGVWVLASSSCLKPSRKFQQSSYRDDCWSGGFHPARQGSRYTPPPSAPHPCPPPTSSESSFNHPSLIAGSSRPSTGSAALAPLKRCRIHTELLLRTAAVPAERRRIPVPPKPARANFTVIWVTAIFANQNYTSSLDRCCHMW